MKRLLFLMILSLCYIHTASAQGNVAVKTNLLYGIGTLTPNLGAEIGLGKHTTLELSGSYNPWNLNGTEADNKKLVHFIIQPEFRYFLCERFNGHYFGVHAQYAQYNIGGHKLPLLFGKGSKNFRYQGNAWGAGLSYGYQVIMGKHWNAEFSLGLGYARMQYDTYKCVKCGSKVNESAIKKNYFGPTKAAVSLIYIIK